jgi:hypothetical protein
MSRESSLKNKQLATSNRPEPNPSFQPYANRRVIAETHAKLGYLGMNPLKSTPI